MLLDAQAFVTSGSIAAALNVTVANIDSPTELNSIAAASGDLRIARTVGATTDSFTLYEADTTSGAQSLPYIVSSATAGVKWIAVAGHAVNNATTCASTVSSKAVGAAGISLDKDTATGNFTLHLSPANLTNTRRWTFPDVSDTVAGLGSTQTYTAAQSFERAATGNISFQAFVTGDSVGRFVATAGGTLQWGSGAAAVDTSLARSGVAALTLTGSMLQTNSVNTTFESVTRNTNASSGAFTQIRAQNDGTRYTYIGVCGTTATGVGGGANTSYIGSNSTLYFLAGDSLRLTLSTTALDVASQCVVTVNNTTEASATGTASTVIVGGLGVAKRAYLGSIGSSFKGNVLAGVQDATAASAGQVGETLSSTVTGVAVAGTGTVGNVTSLSITAGDWLISGQCVISGGATGLTSGSTQKLSIVTTTATNGTEGDTMMATTIAALTANGKHALAIPQLRINISSTTTYYLTEEVTYGAGSPTAAGKLIATRIR